MEQIKEIWPHDLLTFERSHDLILNENPLPKWAKDSLSKAKVVVVRRGIIANGLVPVGLRGYERNQRLACYLKSSAIANHYHPNYFIEHKSWKNLPANRQDLPAFQALIKIIPLLKKYCWGIGGSLAYEMASGIEMVKNTPQHSSDLDLLLFNTPQIDANKAKDLLEKLNQYGVHADLQVVSGQNGFSLEEYANNLSSKILVKTAKGPILTENPWKFLKENK